MTRDTSRAARGADPAPQARACYAGPSRPIRLSGPAAVLARLACLIPGWPRETIAFAGERAEIRIEPGPLGLRIVEGDPPRAATDHLGPEDAAAGLVGALIGAYVEQDPALISIHAAANRVGDALVVMTGDSSAGKSTLGAQLVRLGCPAFGDDQLVLRLSPRGGDSGIALSLPHKLRLPLPEDAGEGFAAFVAAREVCRGAEALALRLGAAEAARFGETAPLAALILLAREAGAPAALETIAPAKAARELIRQGFAPQLPAAVMVEALVGLATRVTSWRLRYGRSLEAARLIAARFGPGKTAP